MDGPETRDRIDILLSTSTSPSMRRGQDEFFSLFGHEMGSVSQQYACAYEERGRPLKHGQMFVTDGPALCFYSVSCIELGGEVFKLIIPYEGITSCIRSNTNLLIPNAITIRQDKTKSHVFRNFWERDECYNMILERMEPFSADMNNRASVDSLGGDGSQHLERTSVTEEENGQPRSSRTPPHSPTTQSPRPSPARPTSRKAYREELQQQMMAQQMLMDGEEVELEYPRSRNERVEQLVAEKVMNAEAEEEDSDVDGSGFGGGDGDDDVVRARRGSDRRGSGGRRASNGSTTSSGGGGSGRMYVNRMQQQAVVEDDCDDDAAASSSSIRRAKSTTPRSTRSTRNGEVYSTNGFGSDEGGSTAAGGDGGGGVGVLLEGNGKRPLVSSGGSQSAPIQPPSSRSCPTSPNQGWDKRAKRANPSLQPFEEDLQKGGMGADGGSSGGAGGGGAGGEQIGSAASGERKKMFPTAAVMERGRSGGGGSSMGGTVSGDGEGGSLIDDSSTAANRNSSVLGEDDEAESEKQLQSVKGGEEEETHTSLSSSHAAAAPAEAVVEGGGCALSLQIQWEEGDKEQAQRNRKAFEKAVSGEGKREAVVSVALAPCKLQEFFQMFVCDEASYGLPDFHSGRDDRDVKATRWQKKDPHDDVSGSTVEISRLMRFRTPINVSFVAGPSEVKTVKKQRARLFGSAGVIIDTTTSVEDRIPMSDNFYIEDRLVVQPVNVEGIEGRGDNNSDDVDVNVGMVRVTITWRCVWVKFCMLKGLIEGTSRRDVMNFNKALAAGMEAFVLRPQDVPNTLEEQELLLQQQRQGEGGERPTPPVVTHRPSLQQLVRAMSLVAMDDTSTADEGINAPANTRHSMSAWDKFVVGLHVLTFVFLVYTVLFWVRCQVNGYGWAGAKVKVQTPLTMRLDELYVQWGRSNVVLGDTYRQVGALARQLERVQKEMKVIAQARARDGAAAAAATSELSATLQSSECALGRLKEKLQIATTEEGAEDINVLSTLTTTIYEIHQTLASAVAQNEL